MNKIYILIEALLRNHVKFSSPIYVALV